MRDMASGRLDRARWMVGVLTAALLLWAIALYSTPLRGCHVLRPRRDRGRAPGRRQLRAGRRLVVGAAPARLGRTGRGLPVVGARPAGLGLVRARARTSTSPPSELADIGFLGFPVAAIVALAVFPSDLSGVGRWRMTLDGLMIACAIGLVSWATALGAVVSAGGDSAARSGGVGGLPGLRPRPAGRLRAGDVAVHGPPPAAGARRRRAGPDGRRGQRVHLPDRDGAYVTDSPIDLGWFLAFGALALASLMPGATAAEPAPRAADGRRRRDAVRRPRWLAGLHDVADGRHERGLGRRDDAVRGARAAGVLPAVPHRARQPAAGPGPHPPRGPAAPPGLPRPADRAGQPRPVHRPRHARPRAAPPRPAPAGDLLPRPRRLQGGQRPAGAQRRRRPAEGGRPALPPAAVRGRDAGPVRRRRVRGADGGPAGCRRRRQGAARQPR